MTLDRRMVLRGLSRAAAAGLLGAALAAAEAGRSSRNTSARPAGPSRPARGRDVAVAAVRWSAARPDVVPRSAWHPDPAHREKPSPSAPSVKAVFVHHTDSGNDYSPGDVPEMIQSFYNDHIESRDWGDIGYNFLVDRTGVIYEGRAGGVDNAVIGAHTLGFNVGTVGIAAIGSYGGGERVPDAMLDSIARLCAWKLGMYGVDARGSTVLVSTNSGSRFARGTRHVFRVISGHRDGYCTDCPGNSLYARLPDLRARAYDLQDHSAPSGTVPSVVPPSFVRRTLS
ncbi:peptidoglycan recognition protein [Streptantibioticus parmotrematis]|uniref:peptidoglycan recognition protein family protein n=1 Tax=Streptantibioticus parmotrematis TaxID=2873249 RepID=UPI0033EE2AFB